MLLDEHPGPESRGGARTASASGDGKGYYLKPETSQSLPGFPHVQVRLVDYLQSSPEGSHSPVEASLHSQSDWLMPSFPSSRLSPGLLLLLPLFHKQNKNQIKRLNVCREITFREQTQNGGGFGEHELDQPKGSPPPYIKPHSECKRFSRLWLPVDFLLTQKAWEMWRVCEMVVGYCCSPAPLVRPVATCFSSRPR